MRVLLLGAGGMLGHELVATMPNGIELIGLTRSHLDITNDAQVERKMTEIKPTVVCNAAAYTAVDRAETEPERALAVNAVAPGVLGRVAAGVGATVVHFSTDYVFDGELGRPYDEDDIPHPLNAYGRSKLQGEHALGESGARFLIVRTQWLFGAHGRSFPRVMWERASHRQPTQVVSDQIGRPTSARDLAAATWRLLALGASGTIHVTNDGTASWYDVAARVFAAAKCPQVLSACKSVDYPTRARRPRAALLDTTRFRELTGASLPDWRESLEFLLVAGFAEGEPHRAGLTPRP